MPIWSHFIAHRNSIAFVISKDSVAALNKNKKLEICQKITYTNCMPKRKRISHHVDKKVLMRARIFGVISIIFIGILLRDLFIGTISLLLLLISVGAGCLLGIVASRMYHLSWNHDGKKVVGRLDSLGVVILVGYMAFAFFRQQIVGYFVHGPMVGTAVVGLMAGLFVGQIIGVRNGVKGILKDEGIIK